MLKLGQVCKLVGGGTPSKSNANFYNGDIPWATVRDLRNRWLEDTEHKINISAVEGSSTNVIPAGNVVLASRVGLGKVVQLKRDTAINQDLRALIPKDNSNIDLNYLYYWTLSITPLIISAGKGATVQGVTLPFLENLEIPVPSLDQQREIVKKLDSAFAEIDSVGESITMRIKNSSELFAKICLEKTQELNPSGFKSLKEISTVITKGTTPTSLGFEFTSSGINFLKVESLDENGGFIRSKFAFIDSACHESLKRSQLVESDVLVSIAGALGRTAIVTANICPANVNQALSLIRLPKDSEISPTFLFALFQSGYFKFELDQMGAGAAQQNLSLAQIGSLKVPIFPESKQIEFIDFLDNLRQLVSDLKNHLEKQFLLKLELQKSILNTTFFKSPNNELVA